MSAGTRLIDRYKFIGTTTPTPGLQNAPTPCYVNLKLYNHATVHVKTANAGANVTGGTLTLNQAQDAIGTGAKPVPFALLFGQADLGANPEVLNPITPATPGTFALDGTASNVGQYFVEVNANDLDVNNGYTYLQVNIAGQAAQTVSAGYILGGARFGGNYAQMGPALA